MERMARLFFMLNGVVSVLLIADAVHSFYQREVEGGCFLLGLSFILSLASLFRKVFYIQVALLLYFFCFVGVVIESFIPSVEAVNRTPPALLFLVGPGSLSMSVLALIAATYVLRRRE
ncbi:hypothetical protein [Lysobacter sp. Root690]|uniref:hypothetical protein n=1 Tax=Lysobacter sp. Root690 TaxID=1736588 RepID=UPI0012F9939D|nr:hypothetical protein [Lysobacter sp. Root690]